MEIDKLSPHIVVSDERAAGIGSESDGDTVCKALLGAVDYALKDYLAVELRKLSGVAYGAIKQRIGKRRRKGRYERRVLLFEERDYFVIRLCAMLDGVDAVFKRNAHALGTLDMGGDYKSALVRLVASRLDILGGHLQHAGLALDLCIKHAAGYHELYQIRLILGNLRDEVSRLLCALGDIGKRTRHVSVRDGDSHVSREYSRTDGFSGVYIIADARIGVFNSADGSDGCNAAVELHLSRAAADSLDYLAEKIVARHDFDKLLRVGFLLLRLSARGKMDMHIDKAGHYVLSAEVYLLISGGIRARVDYGGYLLAVDKNYFTGLGLHILSAVENNAVYECVFHFRFLLEITCIFSALSAIRRGGYSCGSYV